MPLEAKAKPGFYLTPAEIVQILESSIGEKKPGPKRLLDHCCGAGKPAAEMSAVAEWEAYGVEIHNGRSQSARSLLKKVIPGNLFTVTARHESFSVLFLNPPYDFESEDSRTELSFLKHTLPYLAPGGVLFLIFPQKRMTHRIARVLSAYIEDPNVRESPAEKFMAFGQIVVTGVKKNRPRLNEEILLHPTNLRDREPSEEISMEFAFPIPSVPKDLYIRSSETTPEELAAKIPTSSLWKEPALKEVLEHDDSRNVIQPLMPPRKAHLAMLIAAGFINNLMPEALGKELLMKGTSKKVSDRFEEKTQKGIKITEKERTETPINAFELHNGERLQIV